MNQKTDQHAGLGLKQTKPKLVFALEVRYREWSWIARCRDETGMCALLRLPSPLTCAPWRQATSKCVINVLPSISLHACWGWSSATVCSRCGDHHGNGSLPASVLQLASSDGSWGPGGRWTLHYSSLPYPSTHTHTLSHSTYPPSNQRSRVIWGLWIRVPSTLYFSVCNHLFPSIEIEYPDASEHALPTRRMLFLVTTDTVVRFPIQTALCTSGQIVIHMNQTASRNCCSSTRCVYRDSIIYLLQKLIWRKSIAYH